MLTHPPQALPLPLPRHLLRLLAGFLFLVTALPTHARMALSPADQEYLEGRAPIRLCATDSAPATAGESSKGIEGEYLALLEGHLGARFERIPTASRSDSLKALKAGECDILSTLDEQAGRLDYLDLTPAYLESPLVFVTRDAVPFLDGFTYWNPNHTVTVARDEPLAGAVRRDHPEAPVVEVDSVHEGLERVARGEIFAHLGPLHTVLDELRHARLRNLKVSGQSGYVGHLTIGVRHDDPVLLGLLSAAVRAITPEERLRIHQAWSATHAGGATNHDLLWGIAAGTGLLLLFILYRFRVVTLFNRRLLELAAKLEEKNLELDQLAKTDRLTGLYNRHLIEARLEEEIEKARRYQRPFSVILLDIDRFKMINDTHGHNIGDRTLREVAKILADRVRATDVVGRWGGEEFLIVCAETGIENARFLAETLRGLIEVHPVRLGFDLTASFGVAQYHPPEEPKDLVARADKGLYQAKNEGRNRVVALPSE